MDPNLLSLLMFGALLLVLFVGLHVAFGLYAVAIGFAYFLWGAGGVSLTVMSTWGMMNNFPLIAVPLFIFMALVLEKANLVEDIYDCFYKWSGGLRGGLAIATIFGGAIIAAVSGVVAAGVIGLGVTALPQMEKYKYNKGVSLGSIVAGGTLGEIIPPCLVMVVYSAMSGVSVGKLFAAGASAGSLFVGLFILYILIRAYFQKDFAPALAKEDRVGWSEKLTSARVLILPAILIVGVVGSILTGLATPTEAAGLGAFGAVLFSVVTRRFNLSLLRDSSLGTLKVSSMVCWLIGGATAFASVFSGIGGNQVIRSIAMNMPGGDWAVLLLSMAFIFVLGMFLGTMAIIMLVTPIISPILVGMGFDPLWWAIIFMALLQIAYISPPFGVSLFYLKGAIPSHIRLEDIYWASLPFIGLQILAITLIVLFPFFGLWLPNLIW